MQHSALKFSFKPAGTTHRYWHLHRPRSQSSDPSSRSGWGSHRSAECRPDLYACQESPCCLSWSSYQPETPPGTCWMIHGTQTPYWGTKLRRPWWQGQTTERTVVQLIDINITIQTCIIKWYDQIQTCKSFNILCACPGVFKLNSASLKNSALFKHHL